MKSRTMLAVTLALFGSAEAVRAASSHSLKSPDGRIEIRIDATDRLRYAVLVGGKPVVQDATLALDLDHFKLGEKPKVKAAKPRSVDQQIEAQVALSSNARKTTA